MRTTRIKTLFACLTVALVTVLPATATAATKPLPKNSVGIAQLRASAVTAVKVATNAITNAKIANNAVTGAKVKDGSLTAADLAPGTIPTIPAIPAPFAGAAAGGVLTGTYPNPSLAANAVGAAELTADSVGQSELATGAVGADEIIDGSITIDDIGTGAVASDEILDFSITADDLAAGSVTRNQIDLNAIGSNEIDTGAVDNDEIASRAVTGDKLSLPAVGVQMANDQAVVDNGNVTVSFDAGDLWDTQAMHSDVVNPSRLIAPISGVYAITAYVTWSADPDGTRTLELLSSMLNPLFPTAAETMVPISGADTKQSIATQMCLNAAQYATVRASVAGAGNPLTLDSALGSSRATMSLVTPVTSC